MFLRGGWYPDAHYVYNINDNHMMYGSWDMKRDRIFCHLDRSLPFYPPNNPKNQNFEKMKKESGDSIILHMCNINDNQIMYGSWDIEHDRQIFLSFWTLFLPFYPPNNPKYQNFEKTKKTPGDIILQMCTIIFFFCNIIYTSMNTK